MNTAELRQKLALDRNKNPESHLESKNGLEDPKIAERVYDQRVLLGKYVMTLDAEDRKFLKRCKEKVDERISDHIEEMNKPYDERSALFKKALDEKPSMEKVILFSISEFILYNRKDNHVALLMARSLFSGPYQALGGTYQLKNFGQAIDTCVDTSILANELAKMYGLKGEVVKDPKSRHRYWQQKTEADSEASIIDTYWCANRRGFVKDSKEWLATVRESWLSQPGMTKEKAERALGRSLTEL